MDAYKRPQKDSSSLSSWFFSSKTISIIKTPQYQNIDLNGIFNVAKASCFQEIYSLEGVLSEMLTTAHNGMILKERVDDIMNLTTLGDVLEAVRRFIRENYS